MVTTNTLMKIAGIGGFLTAGFGYALNRSLQKRIHDTDFYKEALQIFRDHPKAMKYLGEPVKEGRIELGEIVPDNIKWFKVPLKGSNTQGELYCELFPTKNPEEKAEFARIEITFENIPGKTFVLKE